ncbi:MAG: hypothetical protein GY778_22585 [bacterium]|nr:hypothetical protein [bacterium]
MNWCRREWVGKLVGRRVALFIPALFGVAAAWGQPQQRDPHIGYLYPCGGQRGTVFEVVVGGQRLRGAKGVHISGEHVRGAVVRHYRPPRNLNQEQRQALRAKLRELTERRIAELERQGRTLTPFGRQFLKKQKHAEPAKDEEVEWPEHPLLRNLERKTLDELRHVGNEFFNVKKRQLNAQIAELVLVEVSIDRKAAPGDRELRLVTPAGLTNPMCFQVGLLPETCELEPNDPLTERLVADEPSLQLPIMINGQIRPGDIDRFSFFAKQGQKLVIEGQARHLIPYLADAVPGWFQAMLSLYDDEGDEVAFADDYRFDPDPVLFYEIPKDGDYTVEMRDALYRGREDFVYRLTVGEQPFITQAFPLGARAGDWAFTAIQGWNLSKRRLRLDTRNRDDEIRETGLRQQNLLSNRVTYAVDAMPVGKEREPNDTLADAHRITVPRAMNGLIDQPGDVDVFCFRGGAGAEVVAEVFARRLYSPLDSLLRLTDETGQVLAWNDDHVDPEAGLCTHHADSYLRAPLPKGGLYYMRVSDAQRHGGGAFGYRLRIGPPQPDFALRMTPSSVNVRAGRAVVINIHATRKDGFDHDIELALKDNHAGFSLQGGWVPGGRDHIRATLTAPDHLVSQPVVLELEGYAKIGRNDVRRPVIPAEDMMQAFLYRHLVPSQELLAAVIGKRRGPPLEPAEKKPVRIPPGGTAKVRFASSPKANLDGIFLEITDAPDGVTIQEVAVVRSGLVLLLNATAAAGPVGLKGNLIIEASREVVSGKQDDQQAKSKRLVSLGVLPAIPFEIVPP